MNRIIYYFLCLSLVVLPALSSDNQEFEYKKELFSINPVPDEFLQPSLSDLYQEACKRKLMYDKLFEYVGSNGLNKKVLSIFSSVNNYTCESFPHLTPQISTLFHFKTEFGTERTLVGFYQRCLEKMIQDQSSRNLKAIQALYNHTVHVVRLNFQSLLDLSFENLGRKYPTYFVYSKTGATQFVENIGSFENEEDDLYYAYLKKCHSVDGINLNTIEIWDFASYLGSKSNCITCVPLIFSLNTIHFYLNIEKALLAVCPDLQYDVSEFRTFKGCENTKFVLAAIKSEVEAGAFLSKVINVGSVDRQTQETIDKYSKRSDLQKRFIDSIIKFKSNSAEALFQDIFPEPAPTEKAFEKLEKSKHTKQKNKINGKKKNNTKNKKQLKNKNKPTKKVVVLKDNESDEEVTDDIENTSEKSSILPILTNTIAHTVNDFIESNGTTASKAAIVHLTASRSVEPIDHIVAAFTNDNVPISTASNKRTNFSYKDILLSPLSEQQAIIYNNSSNTIKGINFTSYQTAMSYNKYVYKRNVSARTISSYTVLGTEQKFNFPASFAESFLKEVKSYTYVGVYNYLNTLPNLASYVLRIHYTIKDHSELLTAEFAPQKKYISGAKEFREKGLQYKNENNIITAYNDFLNHEQKNSLRGKQGKDFSKLMTQFMQEKLTTKISEGGFFVNSLDSEALLLLDLVDSMPNYVAQITKNWTTSVEVKGLALAIHSYRDCCWRCRNLIQGFQWSSDNLLQQISARAPTNGILTLSSDYASVVVVSGQTQPPSSANDFFPPVKVDEALILGVANNNDRSKHKFVEVSRKN